MAGEDPQIFITYRREDSAGYAGRLHDALRERIGRDRVFMDIVDIGPGVDFVEAIERAVASATVVFVVIGRQWLGVVDANGWRMPLGAGRCFCHAAGGSRSSAMLRWRSRCWWRYTRRSQRFHSVPTCGSGWWSGAFCRSPFPSRRGRCAADRLDGHSGPLGSRPRQPRHDLGCNGFWIGNTP